MNSYKDTLGYIYEKLPMFSRTGAAAIKPDLTNILRLCAALGDPQNSFRSIHIAGTNGKGSVSHGLAAVLQQAGYKTGLYTSPHLVDFRERIRVNGQEVEQQWVTDWVAQQQELIETVEPSFFEITVAMAFDYFRQCKIEVAVIETGLGGRLDSTNIITPVLSVITNISEDHKDLLGDTLAAIAREKAGIIKPGVPVVIGAQHPETEPVFSEKALLEGAPLYHAESAWGVARLAGNATPDAALQQFRIVHQGRREAYSLETDLCGAYQRRNVATILTAAEVLHSRKEFELPLETAIAALRNVSGATGLRGRWEQLRARPLVIADVAHNPAGIAEVVDQWNRVDAAPKIVVTGFVKDKDTRQALELYRRLEGSRLYLTQAQIPRAMPVEELTAAAEAQGFEVRSFGKVEEAVSAALADLNGSGALLITGSFFVVGEALEFLDES